MNAIILAGGKDKSSLKEQHKLNNKSLLMIKNIPMVEYVVDALRMAKEIDKIIVVGPKDKLVPCIGEKVTEIVDSSDSIVNNIERGINYLNDDRVIILTSDIPLITGEIIDNFIKKCQKHDAFLFYPFISKETILKKYPDTIRSYANLKEGNLCGGNLVIISSSLFNQNKELLNELYKNRKDIKKYAALLGVKFIFKYLFKCLTIKEIEERAAEIAGYPVKGIKMSEPEIVIDLDKISDYELILQILNNSDNSNDK